MFLVKILFLLLIIVCSAFYILYIWDFSLVLLVVIISVPVMMFLMLFITKKMTSVSFAVKDKNSAKNEPFDIQLCVKNRSIFPIGKAEALIEYYNIFNNQINAIELHFPIQPRNTQNLTFQLSSKFCGVINIRSAYITIYDPLRIFKFRIGKNISENIVILPEGHDIGAALSSNDRINDESPIYSDSKPGDDPSEVFDLRDYCPGDKLNRIHWKISSKREDFVVKEYSLPIDSPTMLFLNLHCLEDSEYTLPMFDTLIESLVSISQFLISKDRIHTFAYYNAAAKRFEKCIIDSEEALSSAVYEMIVSISDDLFSEDPDVFISEQSSQGWSSFTFITAEENSDILTYIDNEIDADIKNAVMVVKNEQHAASVCSSYSSLNVHPVVIGRITSYVRDIEM